ncbi:hypothetical protein R3P38DRAFT_1448195 [Favolaschia claudopus]|uniref:Secreted protein n=1 Tax=Favolaschia claudopus TaxID=2862362 RepID=A0AAW0AMR1_9AGAR
MMTRVAVLRWRCIRVAAGTIQSFPCLFFDRSVFCCSVQPSRYRCECSAWTSTSSRHVELDKHIGFHYRENESIRIHQVIVL